MSIIVKVPQDKMADYDYLAFSFCGKHSVEDFGIYRVSSSNSGYTSNLVLESKELTAEIDGMDGQYYFGSTTPKQNITINIAFDNLSEAELQAAKKWLNTKDLGPLWFAEAPHRVYTARIGTAATMTTVAFRDAKKGRVYKGTGQLTFVCYYPYARTPDWVEQSGGVLLDGNCWESYLNFRNYEEIKYALPRMMYEETKANGDSVITTKKTCASAYGDLPFHFKAKLVSPSSSTIIKLNHSAHGEELDITNASVRTENGITTITYLNKGGESV